MYESKATIELESPSGGAFITDIPEAALAKSKSSIAQTPIAIQNASSKIGFIGEIDVINGLLERMKFNTKKINPDSPRTKQALSNLGIQKEECFMMKFEDFTAQTKNEKMKKLLYIYYVGHINDTISQVLKEREKIKRQKEKKFSFDIAAMGSPQTKTSLNSSPKTPFTFLNLEKRMEIMNERKKKDIQVIEKQTMNYLESERDYLKKLEVLTSRLDKAEQKKKLLDEKKKKELEEKKEKYSQTLESIKKKQEEKEEGRSTRRNFQSHIRPINEFKEMFQMDSHRKIEEHKQKELKFIEEQKKTDMKLSLRDRGSVSRSTVAYEEFVKKEMQAQEVLEREKQRKKILIESWKGKYNRTREHALSMNFVDRPELYTRYAEKMIKFQTEIDKIKKDKVKEIKEKKKKRDEKTQKVEEKLQILQRDFDLREELLEEKIDNLSKRMTDFYVTRRQAWDQKVDMNKFKSERSQIHFDKILADDIHKSNIIMAKNKVWKDAILQKQKEKEKIRNLSMQNQLSLQTEKTSLAYYLGQFNKIHTSNERIAGYTNRDYRKLKLL